MQIFVRILPYTRGKKINELRGIVLGLSRWESTQQDAVAKTKKILSANSEADS